VVRADLPPLDENEVYLADLVGCEVVDGAGARIGVVKEVQYAGQELLVVAREGAADALVPFVEPIIRSVDLEARRIVCDPPEGLLNLDGSADE
jgi:16S rRNA processing protein RimM